MATLVDKHFSRLNPESRLCHDLGSDRSRISGYTYVLYGVQVLWNGSIVWVQLHKFGPLCLDQKINLDSVDPSQSWIQHQPFCRPTFFKSESRTWIMSGFRFTFQSRLFIFKFRPYVSGSGNGFWLSRSISVLISVSLNGTSFSVSTLPIRMHGWIKISILYILLRVDWIDNFNLPVVASSLNGVKLQGVKLQTRGETDSRFLLIGKLLHRGIKYTAEGVDPSLQ